MALLRLLIILLPLLHAGFGFAQVTSGRLEPMHPFFTDYYVAVFRILIKPYPILSMIAQPSFHAEYAIYLTQKDNGPKDDNYILHYSIAKKQIYGHKMINKNEYVFHPQTTTIIEKSVPLPPEIASTVVQAWELVLKRTQYDSQPCGVDGISYNFSFGRSHFGRTWCPEVGESKALSELGEELVSYVNSDTKDRATSLKRIKSLSISIIGIVNLK